MRRLLSAALVTTAALTGTALALLVPASASATAQHIQVVAAQTPAPPKGIVIHGPKLWDPVHKRPFTTPSSVTITQDTQLGAQTVRVNWANFTPSYPAAAPYTTAVDYTVMVAECSTPNPTSPYQCFGATNGGAPAAETAYGYTNTEYAVTAPNGTGQTVVTIQTGTQNQFLGCGPTHPCSLVVVPAQGGNSFVTPVNCGDHSLDVFTGGGLASGANAFGQPSATTNESCSWAKRIVIPLHFAPTAASCPLRTADFTAEGSPMLARAMQQWQTGICKGSKSVAIQYNSSVNEYQARSLYASGITDVAFTTQPFASGTTTTHPYTYAPVAVSATSIAYWFDNSLTSVPYTNMRLNARLMAKLLTTSYQINNEGCSSTKTTGCDGGVDGNPSDIVQDPEFQALNPTMTSISGSNPLFPTVLSGPSDMTSTLTSWIAADKDAAGFLAGTFDPTGMHVNTYYLGLKYPIDQFTTQDPYLAVALGYSPTFPLSKIAQYQSLNDQPGLSTTVYPPAQGGGYEPLGPDLPGHRELVAVLDQADAAAYLFPVAALENHAGKFVEPTNAAMSAAVRDMTVNPDGITRTDNLSSNDPNEYPLTMVIYAIVPTGGIPHAKAAKIAQFLDYVAGSGQRPGVQPGELPAGYLPLPTSLRKQTLKAAQEVLDQVGNKPGSNQGHRPPGNPGPGKSSSSNPPPGNNNTSNNNKNNKNGGQLPQIAHEIAVSFSNPDTTGMSWIVLALLIAGFTFAVAGPGTLLYANPKTRAKIAAVIQVRLRTKRK
jgi:hypothetical protein